MGTGSFSGRRFQTCVRPYGELETFRVVTAWVSDTRSAVGLRDGAPCWAVRLRERVNSIGIM